MNIYIINYKRTIMGNFLSTLSSLSALDLGIIVLNSLLKKTDIDKSTINKCIIGNVYSSGNGQNIARQISYNCGIDCPSVSINQVCASGMEAIIQGYNSIKAGESECVLVGGVESMSNVPHLIYRRDTDHKNNINNIKPKCGSVECKDSILIDGLEDAFLKEHVGKLTEKYIKENNFSREEFDEYTNNSYRRAREAYKNNKFKDEVIPIIIKTEDGEINLTEDEEVNRNNLEKLHKLKPVFKEDGIITAGNASNLSDGANMMLLCSEEYLKTHKIKPVAKILGYNSVVSKPENFCIVHTEGILRCCNKLGKKIEQIDYLELNEGYPIVPLHTNKTLNISLERINVFGGAIALGHPLGCSGSRIVGTLITVLKDKGGKLGCASINYGGGGASCLMVENISPNIK